MGIGFAILSSMVRIGSTEKVKFEGRYEELSGQRGSSFQAEESLKRPKVQMSYPKVKWIKMAQPEKFLICKEKISFFHIQKINKNSKKSFLK